GGGERALAREDGAGGRGGDRRRRVTAVATHRTRRPGSAGSRAVYCRAAYCRAAVSPSGGQLQGNGELLVGCSWPVRERPNRKGASNACGSPSTSFPTSGPAPTLL